MNAYWWKIPGAAEAVPSLQEYHINGEIVAIAPMLEPLVEVNARLLFLPVRAPDKVAGVTVHLREFTSQSVVRQEAELKSSGHWKNGARGTLDLATGQLAGFRFKQALLKGSRVCAYYWYDSEPR